MIIFNNNGQYTGVQELQEPLEEVRIGDEKVYLGTKIGVTTESAAHTIELYHGQSGKPSIKPTGPSPILWGDGTFTTDSTTHTYSNYKDYIIQTDIAGEIPSYFIYASTGSNKSPIRVTSIEFDDQVTSVLTYAIALGRDVKKLVLPSSITSLGYRAFEQFYHIEDIYYNCVNPTCTDIVWGDTNGGATYLNNKKLNITIGDKVEIIPAKAFKANTTSQWAPSTIITVDPNNEVLSQIAQKAFDGFGCLKEISLPFIGCNKTPAGDYTDKFAAIFGAMSLTDRDTTIHLDGQAYTVAPSPSPIIVDSTNNLKIPATLEKVTIYSGNTICDYAFANCTPITTLILPENISSIGSYAFSGCSNLSSSFKFKGTTNIGTWAFYNCKKLKSLDFSESPDCLSIPNFTFSTCKMESLILPPNITSIGNQALYGLDCPQLTIPGSVTTIDKQCGYSNRLKTLIVNSGTGTINFAESAFSSYYSLEKIWIGKSMSGTDSNSLGIFEPSKSAEKTLKEIYVSGGTIPYRAFCNSDGLEKIYLGSGIKQIKGYSLASDSPHIDVYIKKPWNNCTINVRAFSCNVGGTMNIYFSGSESEWKSSFTLEDKSSTGQGKWSGGRAVTIHYNSNFDLPM